MANFYVHKGEVYVEDAGTDVGGAQVSYSESRPRNARKVSGDEVRDLVNRTVQENEAKFEARQETAAQARADAAAEAAAKRQALADWLAEAGAPSEVIDAL